jgi:hypothetical protein
MGMTDRQFDSYQARVLKILRHINGEIREKGCDSKELSELIKEMEAELKRP